MRFTFALPELSGLSGGLRVAAQYTRHLLEQGHQVSFAVRRPGHEPGPKRRLLNLAGLGRPTLPLEPARGHFEGLDVPVYHLDEARPVRAASLPDADAIISTLWTTAEWASRLPASKGRHIHFIQGYEDFNPRFSKRVRAVYRQRNDKIVVASWLRNRLLEEFGQDSTVVMNGVDTAKFTAPERPRNEPPRIGFMYASLPDKNSAMAVEVARRIHALRPATGFLSFGTGAVPDDFPDFIAYERLPDQTRIPEIYRSCDLWLFVTRSEGFGLPILEAMASRTPVIATPAGAAPDLIDGRNGVLSSLDAGEFTKSVLDFLDRSPEEWQAASQAAFRTAQSRELAQAAQDFERAVLNCLHRDRAPIPAAGQMRSRMAR